MASLACVERRLCRSAGLSQEKPTSVEVVRTSPINSSEVSESTLESDIALVGGYRDLNVNYNKDGFLFDMSLHGPILGFGIKF